MMNSIHHNSNNNNNNSNGQHGEQQRMNGAATATKSKMIALEMELEDEEEELDSLMRETEGDDDNDDDTNDNSNYITRRDQTVHRRVIGGIGKRIRDHDLHSNTMSNITNHIRGLLRNSIGYANTYRHYCLFTFLAMCSVLLIYMFNDYMEHEIGQGNELPKPIYHPHEPSLGGHLNPAHYDQSNMFTTSSSSSSSSTNNNEDYYEDAYDNEYGYYQWIQNSYNNNNNGIIRIPLTGYVGSSVLSITKVNRDNSIGHYWHDPIHSPYSSLVYKINSLPNSTIPETEEAEYASKLYEAANQYGQWEQPKWPASTTSTSATTAATTTSSIITSPNLKNYTNRDMPAMEFPMNSWQKQPSYVTELLHQAKQLISRVKEGIYTEYGMGYPVVNDNNNQSNSNNNDNNNDGDALLEERRQNSFGIHIKEYNNHDMKIDPITGIASDIKSRKPLQGAAYVNLAGYNGLVRKLLHSIITEDEFYVVVVGNVHTYAANNFIQTQIMQFQYLMEPIFDKLGITLISRNMGMNVSTTTINSLGGADIYGESDILWYIPSSSSSSDRNNYENNGQFDLLHIQGILSGQRMPLLLTPNPSTLMNSTNNVSDIIWMGNIQPGYDTICPPNNNDNNNNNNIPSACKYVHCTSSSSNSVSTDDDMTENNNDNNNDGSCFNNTEQYTSVCWVERSDWNPQVPQDNTVGHENEGYPNPQQHKLTSRKLAMLILHALDDAIDTWYQEHTSSLAESSSSTTTITKKELVFLNDTLWHVTPHYKQIRERVRKVTTTACDEYLQKLDSDICHLEMHAFTEWTPRVTPIAKRLKNLVQGNIADISTSLTELYAGIDLLPPQWKLKHDELDVHMIAMAANMTQMLEQMKNHPNPKPVTPSNEFSTGNDDDNWMFNEDDMVDDGWGHGFDDFVGLDDYDRRERRTNEVHELSLNSYNLQDFISEPTEEEVVHDSNENRQLQVAAVSKTAWTVYQSTLGYCDGSSQSRCNRVRGNKCLLSNHNHYKAGLIGHGVSGSLRLRIPNIREGIILARFSELVYDVPDDFQFIYSVQDVNNRQNSTTTKTLSKSEFQAWGVVLAEDVIIHPILMDKEMAQTEKIVKTMDVQFEIKTSMGANATLLLTHIYFA